MNIRSLAGPTIAVTSRWSWLWLVIGAALLPFTGWQTVIPLAVSYGLLPMYMGMLILLGRLRFKESVS